MAFSWEEAVAFALTLPGAAMEKFYSDIVPKVNGKAFLSRSHEAGSFTILRPDPDSIDMLRDLDPDVFWQSPHYQGTKWILVREATAERDMIEGLIETAWAIRASKAQRAERDARAD